MDVRLWFLSLIESCVRMVGLDSALRFAQKIEPSRLDGINDTLNCELLF